MIRFARFAVLIIAVLALAACNPAVSTSPSASSSASVEPTPTPDVSTAEAGVTLAESDLGMILADAEGRTLYAFTNDVDGQSTCYDECAVNWPALTIAADEEVFAGEGVSSTWLGSVDRDDDSTQITYSGRPLYYFAADAAPGDTAGQGVGGVWFVVGADGQLVGAPEASDQPSDEASDEADY